MTQKRISRKTTLAKYDLEKVGGMAPLLLPVGHGAFDVNKKNIKSMTVKQCQYTPGNHKQHELFVLL